MATLRDISQVVGISEASVSLVLNGRHFHRVSADTRSRIEQAASQLGYQPNRSAQNLARGKTMNIMVLLIDLQQPFGAGMASRVIRELEALHYHALPVETFGDTAREVEMLKLASQKTCDGVLCLQGLSNQSPEVYRDIARRMPFIVRHHVYGEAAMPLDPVVCRQGIDYGHGMAELLSHLQSIGGSRLGLLLHHEHDPRTPPPRRSLFADFLRQQLDGGTFADDVAIESLSDESPLEDWHAAACKLIRDNPSLDVLFVHHLRAVPAVLAALEEHGRRPGRDIAVASVDDNESAKWMRPGLTVVFESLGDTVSSLVEGLARQIDGRPPRLMDQKTGVKFRESTLGFEKHLRGGLSGSSAGPA